MPVPVPPSADRARRRPARTYVLVALDASPCAREFARPLGTVVAPSRALAREAAAALHADVAPDDLRAVAAGSAPAGFLSRALALDGALPRGEPREEPRRPYGPASREAA